MFEASSAYISFSLPDCPKGVPNELKMPKSNECFTNSNKTVRNKDKGWVILEQFSDRKLVADSWSATPKTPKTCLGKTFLEPVVARPRVAQIEKFLLRVQTHDEKWIAQNDVKNWNLCTEHPNYIADGEIPWFLVAK